MSERTVEFEIVVDERPAAQAFVRVDKALARLRMTCWRSAPDPNPMPRLRLFRWLP